MARRRPKQSSEPAPFSVFDHALGIIEKSKNAETIEGRKEVVVQRTFTAEQAVAVIILIGTARMLAMDPDDIHPEAVIANFTSPPPVTKDAATGMTTIVIPTGPRPDQNFIITSDRQRKNTVIKMPVTENGEALGAFQIQEQLENLRRAIVKPEKAKGLLKATKAVTTHTNTGAGNIVNVMIMQYASAAQGSLMRGVIDAIAKAHGHYHAPQLFPDGFTGTSSGENRTFGPSVAVPLNVMIRIQEAEQGKGKPR